MIALGADSIYEGFSGEPGYIRSAATSMMGDTAGNLLVDATNITSSGYGLMRRCPAWIRGNCFETSALTLSRHTRI